MPGLVGRDRSRSSWSLFMGPAISVMEHLSLKDNAPMLARLSPLAGLVLCQKPLDLAFWGEVLSFRGKLTKGSCSRTRKSYCAGSDEDKRTWSGRKAK